MNNDQEKLGTLYLLMLKNSVIIFLFIVDFDWFLPV